MGWLIALGVGVLLTVWFVAEARRKKGGAK